MYCMLKESAKETLWSQALKNWRRWDASELHARRLNAKEVLTPMKGEKLFSQSQMEQSKFLEEIRI